MSERPVRVDALKAAARELRLRSYTDLIVLSNTNDPYTADMPYRRREAEWFAALWAEHGAPDGRIWRLHYRLVSSRDAILEPKHGEPHPNTEKCCDLLRSAASNARHLGLVDPLDFVDGRNPGLVVNAWPRGRA